MNGQDFLLGMSFVDEALVQEAAAEKRKTPAWKRWGAIAACAAFLLAAAVALPIRTMAVSTWRFRRRCSGLI